MRALVLGWLMVMLWVPISFADYGIVDDAQMELPDGRVTRGTYRGLRPEVAQNFVAAKATLAEKGISVRVVSAWRSEEKQKDMFAAWGIKEMGRDAPLDERRWARMAVDKYNIGFRPARSGGNHPRGTALDVRYTGDNNVEKVKDFYSVMTDHGFVVPMPDDRTHIEWVGGAEEAGVNLKEQAIQFEIAEAEKGLQAMYRDAGASRVEELRMVLINEKAKEVAFKYLGGSREKAVATVARLIAAANGLRDRKEVNENQDLVNAALHYTSRQGRNANAQDREKINALVRELSGQDTGRKYVRRYGAQADILTNEL